MKLTQNCFIRYNIITLLIQTDFEIAKFNYTFYNQILPFIVKKKKNFKIEIVGILLHSFVQNIVNILHVALYRLEKIVKSFEKNNTNLTVFRLLTIRL